MGGGGRGPPTWALFDKNLCENKELGPVGGTCARHAPPPRSANEAGGITSATTLKEYVGKQWFKHTAYVSFYKAALKDLTVLKM